MGFVDLLDQIGGFGRFQWLHVTLISLPGLLMASQNLLNNFVAGMPAHHCTPSANHSIPYQYNHSATMVSLYIYIVICGVMRCRYVTPQWHQLLMNSTAPPADLTSAVETEACLDGWTFDQSEFDSTIVTEWDLVCSLRPLKQMSQTIYMGGVLAGAIIFGGLSDRFGRKVILSWSYLQLAILGSCTALSPSYAIFCTLRFLSGMSVSGIILNSVSLKVEWIPTSSRTLVGTLSSFFFTFGQMILAGLGFWLRDWRKLQVAVCLPYFLFSFYSWWLTESARWLVLNRRSEEALKSIQQVARINGKKDVNITLEVAVLHSHMNKEIVASKSSYSAYDLLRTGGMRRISVCLVAVWFSTSFAYYGLAMDLQKFGVNVYLMQIIFGAVDIPAKLLALLMLTFLGRRVTQAACLFLSALVIFINIFVPTDMQTLRTTLACLGKGFTSSSFTCVYLYTGELYPTVVRQTGMGFVSTMARIGSMAAPAVLILDEVIPALPSIVYGGAAVIAGVFACFLPETRDIPLPDTIEDVEDRWYAGGMVSKEEIALKEMKEGESAGLNAL
uniref:Major facilitator superfamily (MFS) profile domain-containing protein n=1 Tax=Gadus morhua TaxID=8049 RepID=A0A8C5BXS5_GADMO